MRVLDSCCRKEAQLFGVVWHTCCWVDRVDKYSTMHVFNNYGMTGGEWIWNLKILPYPSLYGKKILMWCKNYNLIIIVNLSSNCQVGRNETINQFLFCIYTLKLHMAVMSSIAFQYKILSRQDVYLMHFEPMCSIKSWKSVNTFLATEFFF